MIRQEIKKVYVCPICQTEYLTEEQATGCSYSCELIKQLKDYQLFEKIFGDNDIDFVNVPGEENTLSITTDEFDFRVVFDVEDGSARLYSSYIDKDLKFYLKDNLNGVYDLEVYQDALGTALKDSYFYNIDSTIRKISNDIMYLYYNKYYFDQFDYPEDLMNYKIENLSEYEIKSLFDKSSEKETKEDTQTSDFVNEFSKWFTTSQSSSGFMDLMDTVLKSNIDWDKVANSLGIEIDE